MSNDRTLYRNTFYHVFNRGYNKKTLFYSSQDYRHFTRCLEKTCTKFPSIDLYEWCLLPNHFHLLLKDHDSENVQTGLEVSASIPKFMQSLCVSYSNYFNHLYFETVKRGKKLPIFEGRYQAKEIRDDLYLEIVSDYIYFNPVKHNLVDSPEDWAWKSTRNFCKEY